MYHVWQFNRRKNQLAQIKSRPHKDYVDKVPAAWPKMDAANKWAQRNTAQVPYGYKVLKCFGDDCDMGAHTVA